jgi:hypothetical protein
MSTMREKGLLAVRQAVAADQPGNEDEAVKLYMQGLEMLSIAAKRERSQPRPHTASIS